MLYFQEDKPMTRTMKDSGIEWIGEILEDWDVVKVKQLFNLGRGRVIAKTELLDENSEGYPVYSSQTKNNGILGYISTYDYDIPQLTWTTDGANAGTIFLRTGLYNCTNVCGTLSLKTDNSSLNYLLYILSIVSPHYKRKDTNGYKIMNNEMAEIKLVFPPLSEQEKIASILDEKVARIDSIIADTKQSIEELKKYKQSLITETVTKGLDKDVPMKDSDIEWIGKIPEDWEVVKLKDICYERKELLSNNTDGNYFFKYVDIGSVEFGLGIIDKEAVLFKNAPSRARKAVHEGDIIISTVRTYLKAIARIEEENLIVSTGFCVLVNKKNISNSFLKCTIESNYYTETVSSLSTGISYPAITSEKMLSIKVPVPPLSEQNQIVEFLDTKTAQIDKLIQDKEMLIEQYEKYKKSMIYEYVTGKREI